MTFSTTILYIATTYFFIALIHTFLAQKINNISYKFDNGSFLRGFFHFLGEVETVFGIWAIIFIFTLTLLHGPVVSYNYLSSLNFNEPIFVFVIMCMAASRPIIQLARNLIINLAKILPFKNEISTYNAALILGPLLGSFITEPAAMVVVALLLKEQIFDHQISSSFKYSTLGLLFVNISVGGALTNFAAPPILMIAAKWNWDNLFMLQHFGWKVLLIILIGTCINSFVFRHELVSYSSRTGSSNLEIPVPLWVKISHILFIFLVVIFHNKAPFILFLLALFIFYCKFTQKYQEKLKIKESLLVGFFLAGLVTLGELQGWWIKPFISYFSAPSLLLGATIMTAFTDNAALTYLGSLVPNLNYYSKYALVAGALAGGGLTVIANAPNLSGYGILKNSFGSEGVKPTILFLGALPFTIIAVFIFWLSLK